MRADAPDVERVTCDRHQMRVMSNLIANAIKFTPPGGRIAVRAA